MVDDRPNKTESLDTLCSQSKTRPGQKTNFSGLNSRKPPMRLTSFLFLALAGSLASAEDTYYHVPVSSLTITEGQLPRDFQWNRLSWQLLEALQPYAVVDGPGEAFVNGESIQPWGTRD